MSGSGDRNDRTRRIWDLESGGLLHTLSSHSYPFSAVVASPDGRRVVSYSDDLTLKVWDIESGKAVASFSGEDRFFSFAVAPDGLGIALGDISGQTYSLRLANVAPDPLVITAFRESGGVVAAFGCPLCRTWFQVSTSALGGELPCPHCGKMLKLNPFTIEADWRPIARAWGQELRAGQDSDMRP